mmetsp:Transcript_15569/g.26060  ORF Transcript_15569/g.26060 Transcript_15569/m.26060 type:complete len:218 (-) Transcript_15569:72-725(-)
MPSKVFKAGDTVIGKAKNNKGRRGKVQSIISDGNRSSYVVQWADNAGMDTVSNRVIDHYHNHELQIIPPIVAASADRGNDTTITNLSATFDTCLEEIAKIDGYAKFLKAVVRSGASRSGMEQIHTTELFRFLFLNAAEPEVSPSGLVDQAWHTLLLDPLFYVQVCRVLLRRPGAHAYVEGIIGHDSLAGEDNAAQKKRYETCLQMYRAVFGQPVMGK